MATKKKTKTKTAKVGRHRGNPRLWFEGKWLLEAGFTPGYAFDCRGRGGTLVIVAGEGSRTISSKRGLPVIDVCHGVITDVLGDVDRVSVEVSNGRLRITPIKA